jgi:hypothetical protein
MDLGCAAPKGIMSMGDPVSCNAPFEGEVRSFGHDPFEEERECKHGLENRTW